MKINDLIENFEQHFKKYGLNGDSKQEELYKWKLITKQRGRPNTDAEDFKQEIYSLNLGNLCFSYQVSTFRNFAKYEPEEYRNAMRNLLDEDVELQKRIDTFITTCDNLWGEKIMKNFEKPTKAMCDERLISCFLTLKYPEKYTFYKNDMYIDLCNILGVNTKEVQHKLVHFYELLNKDVIPAIEKNVQLIESVNDEIKQGGYIQSIPLLAQTILRHHVSEQHKDSPGKKWLFLADKDDYNFDAMYKDGVMALCGLDEVDDLNEIKKGDVVLAQSNLSDIEGMGNVTGDYDSNENVVYGKPCCKIQWTHKGLWHCADILKEFGKSQFPSDALTDVSNPKDYPYISKIIERIKSESQEVVINDPQKVTMKEVEILKQKKQIILQGAPGTGKTYKTAAIAVAICDGEDNVPSDRDKLMVRYKQLVAEKRIAFTTFHQSMDYEEFVEGIKPETEDGKVTYRVHNGIFREICDEAVKAQRVESNDNFEQVWTKLIAYLDDNDYIDVMLLNGSKTFRVEMNELGTGLANRTYADDNYSKGNWIEGKSKFFNKEQLYNIYRGLPGTPAGGYDKYRKAIIKHLKKEFGLVDYKEGENHSANVKNYVLIIDEINRANISKVLGELITLLEADKRLGAMNEVIVQLPYSNQEFGVPANLYIIGTMNTADRSVGYIDYAIRRRFAFITIKADRNIVMTYNTTISNRALQYFDKVKEWMSDENIIGDIDADNLMVGHSYFLANSIEELNTKMQYEVIPLLREYINDGILNTDIKEYIKDWEEELK